jgi:hypothetical protein
MKHAKTNPFQQLISLVLPYVKSLLDVKNGSLFGLLLFMLWQVGYDSCLKPGLEKLGTMETIIQQTEKQRKVQESRDQLFKALQAEVSDLPVQIPEVLASQPKSLVAVTQSERLLKLAKGEQRLGLLPNRLPGAVVQVVKLVSEGAPKDTTIGEFMGGVKPADPATTPPPAAPAAVENGKQPPADGGAPAGPNAPAPEPPQPTAESMRKLDDKPIPLSQFDYQLIAHGTYAGFADLINQLTLSPKLITIRNLTIKPVEGQPAGVLELQLDVSLLMSAAP